MPLKKMPIPLPSDAMPPCIGNVPLLKQFLTPTWLDEYFALPRRQGEIVQFVLAGQWGFHFAPLVYRDTMWYFRPARGTPRRPDRIFLRNRETRKENFPVFLLSRRGKFASIRDPSLGKKDDQRHTTRQLQIAKAKSCITHTEFQSENEPANAALEHECEPAKGAAL